MPSKPLFLFCFCASFILGCGVQTSLTRTGPKLPARPQNCQFEMLTGQPAGNYIEVGTLDLTAGGTTNLGEFREGIQPQVCRAGGDAALAIANGYGIYIKATVLKRVDASVPPPGFEGSPRLPPAQPPAAASGCSYDTQCKGDRVCVQGACVDSPAGAASKK
ncbi:MAG: hypothetical protein JWO86_7291 [Myxococcaceae bacterium]|jgi:hypothetical protein|nr:hypothetical protein [Myxococcaceae bacterium]MEA2748110.1 hypothetical protein [Myxococcales bacterium]